MKFENNLSEREILESQFYSSEQLEIEKEKFDIIDVNPKEKKTKTPTIIVPGWVANPEV